MSDALPQDFELLAASYLVADISADDVKRLDALLRSNPAATHAFAALAMEDIALRQAMRVNIESGKPQSDSVQRILTAQPPVTRRRFARWTAVAAACLVIAAAVAFSLLKPPTAFAAVESAAAGATIRRDNLPQPIAASARTELLSGDTLTAPSTGNVKIAFCGEATVIELNAGASLRMHWEAAGKRFELLSGTIVCSVDKQPARAPMTVTTALAIAEVVGTRFTLGVEENLTRLDVSEGRVKILRRSDSQSAIAAADQQIEVTPDEPLKAMPSEASLVAAGWRALIGSDLKSWTVMNGEWQLDHGQLHGIAHGRTRHDSALLRTIEKWSDFELMFQVRVDAGGYSEFQIRDDDWQFQNPCGDKVGIWREVYIKALGPTVTCTLDGQPAELDEELSKKLNREGNLGFYVTRGGNARFRNIHIRPIKDPKAGLAAGQDF